MSTAVEPKKAPELSSLGESITPGIYEHYKKNRYKVMGVALHTETLEECVFYQALYGEHRFWIRPIEMFCETVTLDSGEVVPRFKKIED